MLRYSGKCQSTDHGSFCVPCQERYVLCQLPAQLKIREDNSGEILSRQHSGNKSSVDINLFHSDPDTSHHMVSMILVPGLTTSTPTSALYGPVLEATTQTTDDSHLMAALPISNLITSQVYSLYREHGGTNNSFPCAYTLSSPLWVAMLDM